MLIETSIATAILLGVRWKSLFGTNCSMRDGAFERLNRFAAPIMIRTTFGSSSGVEQAVQDRPTKSPYSQNTAAYHGAGSARINA